MNQALKQRLVGALVLVALAVIFLPALFNGGRPKQLDALKNVPAMPSVPTLAVQEPLRPQGLIEDPAIPARDMYSMEPKPTSTIEKIHQITQSAVAPSRPSLNTNGVPNAWVLQVGVFSEKTKAEALKKSLQGKGYRAFTRTVLRDKTYRVTRVMIGPEVEQAALIKMKVVVDKEFSVKSMVIKFES